MYSFEKMYDGPLKRAYINENRCDDCYWDGSMGECINEKERPKLKKEGAAIKLASKGRIWSSYYALVVATLRHLEKGCTSFICPTWWEVTILRFYYRFKMQKLRLLYIKQLENKYRQETKAEAFLIRRT